MPSSTASIARAGSCKSSTTPRSRPGNAGRRAAPAAMQLTRGMIESCRGFFIWRLIAPHSLLQLPMTFGEHTAVPVDRHNVSIQQGSVHRWSRKAQPLHRLNHCEVRFASCTRSTSKSQPVITAAVSRRFTEMPLPPMDIRRFDRCGSTTSPNDSSRAARSSVARRPFAASWPDGPKFTASIAWKSSAVGPRPEIADQRFCLPGCPWRKPGRHWHRRMPLTNTFRSERAHNRHRLA
jgi:hypothetical protein